MKLLRLLIPAFALMLFLSCSTEPPIDYAIFSGKIENQEGNVIKVQGNDFEKEIAVAEDGTFSDTLRIETGYYSFSHAEYSSIYLSPGHNLNLTLNAVEFDETVKYTGQGSEINNYMASKTLKIKEFIPDYIEFYMLNEADYVAKTEGLKTAYLGMLESVKEVDASFYELEKRNIMFNHLTSISGFEARQRYYGDDPDFKATEALLVDLENLDYDNSEDYRYFSSYRKLVMDKFIDYYVITGNPDTIITILASIKELKSENIKNGLMNTLRFYLSPSFDQLNTLYEGIMEISTDEENKAEITEKYNKVQNLVKGQPAPTFNYIDYAGGKMSMDDLKGKYIYFDIWATWCGPCIREIPYLKETEEKYSESNIQFVSVSIDAIKDFEKWKEFIVDKELGGIQLYADGDWKSSIITDYAIEGIPRFILVDPEGNIVSADAPRPSDSKLTEMLDGLLEFK
jgi:thiol-disulfide isomerase/thioredoxin